MMSEYADFKIPLKFRRESKTATVGQTIFNLTTVSIPSSSKERVMIIAEGMEQPEASYGINSPTQVEFTEAFEGGETLDFIVPGY